MRPSIKSEDDLLKALAATGCKITGRSCTCPHPSHDDQTPSASILHGDDGTWRVFCHRCNERWSAWDIASMMEGIETSEWLRRNPDKDEFENYNIESKFLTQQRSHRLWSSLDQLAEAKAGKSGGKIEGIHRYQRLAVIRIRLPDGTKTFRQAHATPAGWTDTAPSKPWEIYHLEKIAREHFVVMTEGEKKCDALWAIGIPATSTPCGAGKAHYSDLSPLAGKQICLWPDFDDAGREHADQLQQLLLELNPKPELRRIDPTELNLLPKGDAIDFIEQLTGDIPTKRSIISRLIQVAPRINVPRALVAASPFQWIEPRYLAPRRWLYGTCLVRGMLSLIGAAGGVGKSAKVLGDSLALVSNRTLFDDVVHDGPHRVWYWNLEDPLEEIQRRIIAACQFHSISEADLGGRLFIDSGRDSPLCVATGDRDGVAVQVPIIEALVRELKARCIDVLIVDPYVSSHAVAENDNSAQDRVAKAWAQVAHRADCSVLLVHHIRKTGNFEATAESLRGAKALVDAARSVRVLNLMTREEAERAGLETHRGFFRSDDDKSNLAPSPEQATWFRIISVHLENDDDVGVVTLWRWPSASDGISDYDLCAVQEAIEGKYYRESSQAQDWIGYTIVKILRLNPDVKSEFHRVKRIIRSWIGAGHLAVVEHPDAQRRMRRCVVVGKKITALQCSRLGSGAEHGVAPSLGLTAPLAPPSMVESGGGGAQEIPFPRSEEDLSKSRISPANTNPPKNVIRVAS